jgi:ATP-dependent helicase/nuclease subunit B
VGRRRRVDINHKHSGMAVLSEQFLKQLQSSDLVLTANRRLATYLIKQYDLVQIAKGHQAFETLNCLPLVSWVEQTFNTYSRDPRIILNDFQENLLWQDILSTSPMGDGLINVTATAKLVKDSWGLLQHWCLDLEELNHSPSSDVQTFVFWCKQFQLKCQQLHYLSRTQILPLLTKFLMQNIQQLELPKRIFLIGFDDLTPGIKALQAALGQNCEISTLNLQNDKEANSVRMGFFDHQEELMAMARWAYHQYQQNPVAKIGCIVPSLNQERNTVERLFYEIARAEKMSDEGDSLINISAANPLSYYPIIRHALMLLQLNFTEINFETFSQLLRSPFIAGANTEQNQRAKCDAKLRQHGELKINVSLLAQSDALKTCPIFLQQLQAFLNKTNQQLLPLEQWALHFSEQLTILGWPGDQSLDSTEFQITERFKKCFDEFITMHYKNENFSFAIAYNLFQDLVNKVVFQPESRDTPIQILGLLEGTGMQFDYLWVAGLTNESWPPPAAPNPFIPIQLQKKYGMPHATCEREFQFSSNVMQRLKHNAQHLVFSYAQHEGDRSIEPSS